MRRLPIRRVFAPDQCRSPAGATTLRGSARDYGEDEQAGQPSRAAPLPRKARFRRSLATQRPHSRHMLCRSNGLIVEIIC
jgi:hypothetical protein